MSLLGRNLGRIAKIAIFVAMAMVFPNQAANAGATFGSTTYVHPTALGSYGFTDLQGSLDGSILIMSVGNSYLLKSTDSGTTWSAVTSAGFKDWNVVSINDSGTVIVAAESNGSIWLSTNSGSTWTQQTSGVSTSVNWYSIDMNATGSVIVASDGNSLYVTTNTGTSWTNRSVGAGASAKGVAVSSTGDRMTVYSSGDTSIYTSSNYGTNWNKQTAAGTTTGSQYVWMSRDGQRILFNRNNGAGGSWLGVTQNFGSTWETVTGTQTSIVSFGASDDLKNIVVGPNSFSIRYTSDSGTTWANQNINATSKLFYINPSGTRWVIPSPRIALYTSDGPPTTLTARPINVGTSQWLKTAISTDGAVLAATSYGGEISTSRDGGSSWTSITSLGSNSSWSCLAISGDGNTIYVGGSSTRLYKSTDKGLTFNPLSGGTLPASAITFNGCATNSDGSKVAILYSTSGIHYSSNSGTSFALVRSRAVCASGTADFNSITMTSDGVKLAATCQANNTPVYVSSNSGTSWDATSATSTRFFYDIKSAADGSILIAVLDSTSKPFISKDWGASWSNASGVGTAFNAGLSVNSDGSLILLGQTNTPYSLYYSIDRGSTFTQVVGAPAAPYASLSLSGNSTKLLLANNSRQLATMTVSLIFYNTSFSSFSVGSTAAYRTQTTLTATVATAGADGKVTFKEAGKNIAGCIKVPTISLVATCQWKPTKRGSAGLSAVLYPNDASFLSGSTTLQVSVGNRTGNR